MKYLVDIEVKTKRGNVKYLENLREIAINNRKNPTQAEFIMWQYLRRNKFGYKFTRQKLMFRFVLDFYCSELLLAIEIDGDSHDYKKNYDEERDKYLEKVNIKTIRITNEDVLTDFLKIKNLLLPLIKGRCHEVTEGFNAKK